MNGLPCGKVSLSGGRTVAINALACVQATITLRGTPTVDESSFVSRPIRNEILLHSSERTKGLLTLPAPIWAAGDVLCRVHRNES